MEFLLLAGIIIAVFGGLTIVAVLRQDDGKRSAAPPAGDEEKPASDTPEPEVAQTESHAAQPVPHAASPAESAPPDEAPVTIESITALYAHANDDEVAVVDNSLQLNVEQMLATQIEQLYEEYLRLEEERLHLSEALLTHMLFEKIERSSGRLEIATQRETLNLRQKLSKVSADYHRTQFRLGSLQHLNARLGDPRVAQQVEELVQEVKRLASKT